jgi:hypothetical protein
MNRTDELFDNRIADWLEEDPVRAPAQLLETVLAALPSVPQRRAGSAWQPAALPRWWQLVAAAALVVVIGLLGLKALTPPTVAPSQSPEPSVTQPAQTSTPGPTRSAAVATATPAAGEPLPQELLGAWSHAAGGWWWFLPPGDLECVQAVHTAEACAVWDRQVTTAEIGSVTYAANVVSIRWRSGFCNGVTGVYTVQLEGDALTLIEHPGGCEGDNLVLTRAGTGSAPTAPPPPTP